MTVIDSAIARIACVATFALCGGVSIAAAQTVPASPAAKAPDPKPAAAPSRPKTKGSPRVIELDAMTVEGEVQKPEAFYILQRSKLNFKGLEPAKSFIPLILESVSEEPF